MPGICPSAEGRGKSLSDPWSSPSGSQDVGEGQDFSIIKSTRLTLLTWKGGLRERMRLAWGNKRAGTGAQVSRHPALLCGDTMRPSRWLGHLRRCGSRMGKPVSCRARARAISSPSAPSCPWGLLHAWPGTFQLQIGEKHRKEATVKTEARGGLSWSTRNQF